MENTRSLPARIGLLVLNFVGPGLGLVRLGFIGEGLFWGFISPAFPLIFAGLARVAPQINLTAFELLLPVLLLIQIAIILIPAWRVWRRSLLRTPTASFLSRWYGLIGLYIAIFVTVQISLAVAMRVYHSFSIPSVAMMPGLEPNDLVFADMRGKRPIARGEVVIFRKGDVDFVKRIAALAGDRIEMRRGVPIVNGIAAAERFEGMMNVSLNGEVYNARVFREKLPGERGVHRILKIEPTSFDDVPPLIVPPGKVYVLGDDRDQSDDSRVPEDESVVGMPDASSIIGQPLFVFWNREHVRIGSPIL